MDYEKRRAWKRAWKKKNRDKVNAYQRAHRAAHPEIYAVYDRRANQKVREKMKADPALRKARNERTYERRKADPKRYAEQRKKDNRTYAALRAKRLQFRGTKSRFLKARLFQKQKGFCVICKIDLRLSGSHLDHIIPVSKGGSNLDYNFQLLCPQCNCSKSNQLMVC